MKIKLFIFLVMICLQTKAQSDTATIFFSYPSEEISLLNKLNDIKFIKINCKDLKAKGCKFFLRIDEYRNGKLNILDKHADSCLTQNVMFLVGKDTMWEKLSLCDRLKFDNQDSIFKILIAGKLQNKKFKLVENYPSISNEYELDGDNKFELKELVCGAGEQKIELEKFVPILAYSPPFQSSNGFGASYCILGTQGENQWYEKFKVKHYYIINLKISKK